MAHLEGTLLAANLRLAIAVARFNHFITDRLLDGALQTIVRHGGEADQVTVVRVPGAYELPLAVQQLARSGRYDAVVALGAVIRGATPHFDFVASAAAKGLADVSRETGIPVGFGVLTTDSVEQAIERAGSKSGNKGEEATLTAIEMANLLRTLGE
ncbi:MAG: 6,7-dimethyl-8-ribityllumazine synthase [Candidatus Lambdaproteobacteria bacterium]|nr:6,7-dimethyl-8-ribityllumazine synthase [Candidatus Lambdaproteobacteria bacterium]